MPVIIKLLKIRDRNLKEHWSRQLPTLDCFSLNLGSGSGFQLPATASPGGSIWWFMDMVLCHLCGNSRSSSWLPDSAWPRPSHCGPLGSEPVGCSFYLWMTNKNLKKINDKEKWCIVDRETKNLNKRRWDDIIKMLKEKEFANLYFYIQQNYPFTMKAK